MKRCTALFLVLVLIFSFSTLAWFSPKQKTFEGKGFETVEALIEEYIKCLNEGDLNGMISCYAIETYVDCLDVEAYLNHYMCASLGYSILLPASSDFSRQILVANRHGKVAEQIYRYFAIYTLSGTEYSAIVESNHTIALKEPETVHNFVEVAGNSTVNDWKGHVKFLSYADCDELTEGRYSNSICKENRARFARFYGCDEYIDRPCYLNINGTTFLLSFGYGNFGGRWYIIDGGNLNIILGLESRFQGLVSLNYLH